MLQLVGIVLLNFYLVIKLMGKVWIYGKILSMKLLRAIGCLICELTDGNPLFPGNNEID
jgi:cyclin-dependent kinase-like